jgi:hypothetical protein
MKYRLQDKQYNIDLLHEQLQSVDGYEGYITQGDAVFVVIPDDNDTISEVDTIASNHDSTKLTQAEMTRQARQAIRDGSTFSNAYASLLTASFNDPLQTLLAQGTLSLSTWYATWRQVYNYWLAELGVELTVRIDAYNVGFELPNSFSWTEPDPLTDEYRVTFNKRINGFLGYITDLAQY